MSKPKLVSFTISEDETEMTPEEIESAQFTKIHFRIYSADRVNDHNYTCSLKILKKYAKTISGKPILVWYNKHANGGKGDFSGHEDSVYAKEYPVGFFPEDVKITYEKDDDGTIFLCADGYIWSLYYSEIVKVFEDYGGIKGVSSEMLIIDSEIIEDTDIENILQYSFSALTLIGEQDALGQKIKPAVDGCQGILVTNATTNADYEKAKTEFEKILYSSPKQESIQGSFFDKKSKEVNMENEAIKNSNTSVPVDNATQEVTDRVFVGTDTYTYDDDGNYIGSSHEEYGNTTTKVVDVPEEDVKPAKNAGTPSKANNGADEKNAECKDNACKTNNASIDEKEFEALKIKCSELEEALNTREGEYKSLLIKCSELETYKNNKETENMKKAIEGALNSVSHILNTVQIDEWREKAQKCSIDKVDDFTNKLKAFAFDIQEKNGTLPTDSIRNSIPVENSVEPQDLWDRIEKVYA